MLTNKISISRVGIEIQCARNDEVTRNLLSTVDPLHSNRIKTKFHTSVHNVPEILKLLRNIDESNITTAPLQVQKFYYSEMAQREHIHDLMTNGHRGDCRVNEHLTLMSHQQQAREIARYADRYAFFYDTRTGKTPMSLSIMNDDIKASPHNKWLVVCPLILIDEAWIADSYKFFPNLSIQSCHAATPKKRIERINEKASVYVTNTESFVRYREHFDKVGFAGCFIDESSDMKSPRSNVSKELVDFAQTIPRFYLLSGTPAPNGEWEYYMQLKAVDFYGVPSTYGAFKEKYFYNTSYNPQFEKLALRADKKDELYALVKKHAIYVDKEDCLTTPGRTFHEVEIEMPPGLQKHYTKLKNDLYLEVSEDNTITAASSAAKLNKLNQVTSGFIIDTQTVKENKFYDEDNPEWHLLDMYRITKLLELLDSENVRGEQVIIWANYHVEFELIQNVLGDRCRCVYGKTKFEDKKEAIKAFKEKRIQYLVANPASADKGLTLTNAHIAIYYSLNWSYELFKQSMERIYGSISSQPKHCDYYVLIAKGTVDKVLYSDVLQGKQVAGYAVLNHLKSEATYE